MVGLYLGLYLMHSPFSTTTMFKALVVLPLRAGLIRATWTYKVSCIKAVHMSPALSMQRFCTTVLQTCNRMFYFSLGLPRKIQPQGCVAKVQASCKTRFCVIKSSTLVTITAFIVALSKLIKTM